MERLKLKDKRGDFGDILFVVVILIAIVLVLMVFAKIFKPMNDELKEQFGGHSYVNETLDQSNLTLTARYDYLITTIYLGLLFGIIISAFLIPTNRIFAVLYIMFIGIGIIMAVIVSNVHGSFINDPNFVDTQSYFTKTNFILENYPMLIFITAILGLIVTFARIRSGGGEP